MKCDYAGCDRFPRKQADGWDFCLDHFEAHKTEAIGAVPPPRATAASAPTYCGTSGGYNEHLTENTEPCGPCIKAYGDALRSRRKRAKKKAAAAAATTDSATPADVCRVDGDLGIACWTVTEGEAGSVQQVPGVAA